MKGNYMKARICSVSGITPAGIPKRLLLCGVLGFAAVACDNATDAAGGAGGTSTGGAGAPSISGASAPSISGASAPSTSGAGETNTGARLLRLDAAEFSLNSLPPTGPTARC
ncbi:MAG TPA: hypothetical protein VHW01_10750 [Polyangiaceae bacterium]|nr:hypothetical protein [Polyangiaceae bacterium]